MDLEQGSQEALKQRSVGKFDRLFRKEHPKERKERSLSDERAKLKPKQEKKQDPQPDESQQKDGAGKVCCDERAEKKPKIKSEKRILGVTEDGVKDAALKKTKGLSVEAGRTEKEKNREKEKDKSKEREKPKGEKSSTLKHALRPDSTGSSEERSDMDPGNDGSKKKEKHSKEVLKRPKGHTEDRHGEKIRSKDGEKERTKGDLDGQKPTKPSSDGDKDQRRTKLTEKRVLEKFKPKPKEDTKPPFSKADPKGHVSEVKSPGGPGGGGVGKPERKKEGNAKEPRKVPLEESLAEKVELSALKKKTEKKEKLQEKRSQDHEERKQQTTDKDDEPKTDVEEEPRRLSVPRDASTDSDAVATNFAASFSEDTCDALSDITPEPPEGDADWCLGEAPPVPAEADALLTLMDFCASVAPLPPESGRARVTSDPTLQDADMKMKEAALTLLSMDGAGSAALICQNTGGGGGDLCDRETAEGTSAGAEPRPTEASTAASAQPVEQQPAESTDTPGTASE